MRIAQQMMHTPLLQFWSLIQTFPTFQSHVISDCLGHQVWVLPLHITQFILLHTHSLSSTLV